MSIRGASTQFGKVRKNQVDHFYGNTDKQSVMTLDQLRPGEEGFISRLSSRDKLGRRLLDMGVYPGLHVSVIRNAPLEDPMEIRLDGYHISLRHEEAKVVEILQK